MVSIVPKVILFDYIKMSFYLSTEKLGQHRRIAWIGEIRIEIVFGKIEKCHQAGESSTFCLGFATFGELIHEVQNVING
jgi:hypothetical protein